MPATLLFPMAALLMSVLSFFFPQLLAGRGDAIVPLLGLVMFGMGMTLRLENFLAVMTRPRLILLGVMLQFGVMPLLAWSVATLFGMDRMLLIGMVLVGACPGGTASNVICYLARGDVALSITLTTTSTLLAVILTPLMTWLYVGQHVAVPVVSMMLNILTIIILPVAFGSILNHYAGASLQRLKQILPFVSVAAIVLIIGIIVAMNHVHIVMLALPVVAAVFWHNCMGLLVGYSLARILGFDERLARTLAIETGMQNSGLGVALAQTYFPGVAALPGAVFSLWHNITGSMLAGYWSRRDLTGESRQTISASRSG